MYLFILIPVLLVLIFLLGGFLCKWVFGSIRIKSVSFQKRHQKFFSYDPNVHPPPPAIYSYMLYEYKQITSLGFELAAYLYQEGGTWGMRAYLTIFYNPATGDRAMALVMQTRHDEPTSIARCYVEFYTKYLDEAEVNTSNSETPLGTFYRRPRFFSFQYPNQKNAVELYRYHRALLGVYGSRQSAPKTVGPSETISQLQEDMAKSFDYQAERGLYWLESDKDTYRYTWFGAIRSVFLLITPVVQLRKAMRRRRYDAALRDAMKRTAA